MISKQKDREQIVKSLEKMNTNKNLVRSYIKGKISLKTLSKKGIKFAKPL